MDGRKIIIPDWVHLFFLDSFATKETVNRIICEKVNVDYYWMTEWTYLLLFSLTLFKSELDD